MKSLSLFFRAIPSFILILPVSVLAADYGLQVAAGNALVQKPIDKLAGDLILAILGIVGALFIIMIIYGGITWMLGGRGGNEKEIEKAKTIISAAVIGLVIIVTAYVITYFIVSELTTATSNVTAPVTPPATPK